LGFAPCWGSLTNRSDFSEFCGITSAGFGGVVCLDNDTPLDPSDDRLTLFLNPSGNSLSSGYTVTFTEGTIFPATATYGFPNGFVIDPNDSTVPTYEIVLTDLNNPGCTFVLTFDNPCYSTCDIQQVDVLDVSCNDNNTPSFDGDDYITMEIEATGTDVALEYNIVASPGLVLPGSGFYNIPEFFQLTPGSAGNGPVSFILTDQGDLTCQYIFTIQDPGTCVSPCVLTAPNLLGVQCDDMDTPFDPDDDELLITLNPAGISTGNTYFVSAPGLTFTDPVGNYGNPTTFRLTNAAQVANSFVLTITDGQSSSCTVQVFINNTAPCSTPLPCDISNTTPSNVDCSNGDVINFTLMPSSSNGTQYNLTIPDGTILGQNTGTFGTPTAFSFLPNTPQSGNYTVTIRDANNNACTSTLSLDNPCDNCNLTDVNILDVQCGDNGTGVDPTDDQMVITIQPLGDNLASGYSVVADGASTVPANGTYNTATTFTLAAGTANSANVSITIIDNDDPACTYSLVIPGPGSCSDNCTIFDQGLISIGCDNNSTISDATDDFILFTLNVPANSSSSAYNITADGSVVTPSTGLYNIQEDFMLPLGSAGDGGLTITLTDQNNPGCSISFFLFDPGDCSAVCNIQATEVNLLCQDGGTPGIFSDDTYQVTYEVSNPTAPSGSIWFSDTPAGDTAGDYGDLASLGPFLISDGPITITFTDEVSPNCSTSIDLIPPPPCSDTCIIQSAELTNLTCDNDTLQFELSPLGNALDTSYTIQIDSGTIIGNPTGYYGEATSFSFLPELPLPDQYEVVITDSAVSDCQYLLTLDNVCKSCEITSVELSNAFCNDNGTASLPDDDYIEFELLVESEYGTSYRVELASGSPIPGTGTYGSTTTFILPAGSAGGGNVPLVVRDISNPTCSQVFVMADPGSCSDACLITDANVTDITCDDNGTPGDPSDDIVAFNLLIDGLNTGNTYTLSTATGDNATPSQGAYGVEESFNLSPGSVETNISAITITDDTSGTCTTSLNITSPGSCSDSCAIEVTLVDVNCLDNGTASNSTDDLFEFTVEASNPVGTEGWLTIPPIGMESGEYDSLIVIGPYPISGGGINLAFIDQNLTSCFAILTVPPPLHCSDSCALQAEIEVLNCEDGDTPGTTADDTFFAGINVTGLNNGSGWVLDIPIDTSGLYDSTYVIGPFLANNPSTSITLSDLDSLGCSLDLEILSPGTCSAGCNSSDTTYLFTQSCNPMDTGVIVTSLSNQLACDSFIITQTTLLPSDTTLLFSESCNQLDTGTVVINLNNQFGCDSTVITQTTLLPSDTTLLFSESCNQLDTGTVVTSLNNQFGCDSTVITQTTLLPSDTTLLLSESCNQLDTGTLVISLNNQFGCDSTVITQTSLLASDTTLLFSESCSPLDTGTVAQNLTNQFGCDSTVITQTTLLPSDTVYLSAVSCNPQDTGTTTQVLTNQVGCDSIVVLSTTLAEEYLITNTAYTCNPQDTGSFVQTFDSQFGCDSIVITQTLLLPSDTTLLFSESCNAIDTGTVVISLNNEFGCDSTVITQTTLLPSDTTLLFSESCNAIDTGTVVINLNNQFGCDSTVITQTTLLPSDTTLLFSESCSPLDTGTLVINLNNQFGCDSTVITQTTLLPSDTTLLFSESCSPLDTGTVAQNLTNQLGCDSTVITQTTLLPSDTTLLFSESCSPLDTGTVAQNLNNQFGCDSTVITQTTLLPSDTVYLSAVSCNPQDTGTTTQVLTNQVGCDSIVVLSTTLAEEYLITNTAYTCNPQDTGSFVQTFDSQFGCDSIVITQTTLLPSDTTLLFSESCNPIDTGTVVINLTNQLGCDSTVITQTTLLPSDTTLLFSESCNAIDTGTVVINLTNQLGCDSTVITQTTLLPSDTTLLFSESCNPIDTGTVVINLNNQFGCDSTVITQTTLLPSDTTLLFSESCSPLDTGTVVINLTNQLGCDSTVITQTTLLPSDTTLLFSESCNPIDTGTVVINLTNQLGCDSTVITQTTLLPSDTTLLFSESCNPQDTGTVAQNLTNQFGCDSTVIMQTTLLLSDTTLLFSESCSPQDTGTVAQTLVNQFGCDSTVITQTALLPSYQIPIVLDICSGDSVLFNGTYYSEQQPTGIDTLDTVNGCDSILEVSINVLLQPEIRYYRDTLCETEILDLFGTTYTAEQSNGQHVISSLENGCDSVIINIELQFNHPIAELELSDPDCPGDPGRWSISQLTGGLPPYTYAIDGTNFEVAEGLPLRGPIAPGDYALIIRDALGCEAEQAFSIEEMPPLALDLGSNIRVTQGDTVTLNPQLNFVPDSILWSPAGLLDCINCLTPSFIPDNNTVITLLALMDAGCETEDEILIQVDRRVPVYAPNVFSPNGDESNDYFTLFAKDNQVVEITSLLIFDRWGNQVFEQRNFSPSEESLGWDGRSRGQLLNSGVFVYKAEVALIDGQTIPLNGEVLLMR
jgi:gliding motility-associated-like protein